MRFGGHHDLSLSAFTQVMQAVRQPSAPWPQRKVKRRAAVAARGGKQHLRTQRARQDRRSARAAAPMTASWPSGPDQTTRPCAAACRDGGRGRSLGGGGAGCEYHAGAGSSAVKRQSGLDELRPGAATVPLTNSSSGPVNIERSPSARLFLCQAGTASVGTLRRHTPSLRSALLGGPGNLSGHRQWISPRWG
jgi:hypothetical protein